jgi:rubredoxin
MAFLTIWHDDCRRKTKIITQTAKRRVEMARYECPCGYVYDPAEGDAENNIQMGTPFEDLPDDWVCPKCGAEKEFFEKLD